MMSFSRPWGVEKIILAFFHNSPLFSGLTIPVNTAISFPSITKCSLKTAMYWSIRGFVGPIKRTFEFGYCLSLWAESIRKMFVLPIPVGSTTKVFFSAAVASIVCWYSLGSKFLIIENREYFWLYKVYYSISLFSYLHNQGCFFYTRRRPVRCYSCFILHCEFPCYWLLAFQPVLDVIKRPP